MLAEPGHAQLATMTLRDALRATFPDRADITQFEFSGDRKSTRLNSSH